MNGNAKLVYDYTLNFIEEQRKSLVRLDIKFAFVLSLSVLKLDNSAAITSGIFALTCAGMCLRSLSAKVRGSVVDPAELLQDEIYERDPETNRCYIVKGWLNTSAEYEKLGIEKSRDFNICLALLFISLVLSLGGW